MIINKRFLIATAFLGLGGLIGCLKESADVSESVTEDTVVSADAKSELIPGSYVVVFEDGAFRSSAEVSAANYWQTRENYSKEITRILEENGIKNKELKQVFVKVYKGTALDLTESEVGALRRDNRVVLIEQEQTYHISAGGPPGGGGGGGGGGQSTPWGVTRVGGAIDGSNAGRAWIIDSGIDLDHPDLNVDLAFSATFLGSNTTPDDQNGHGTHVAGTVGAKNNTTGVVGVASDALVVAVRVLNRNGSGTTSGVIAGVDYVAANAAAGDAANMSLGGGASTALDNAVLAASSSCPFAVAAGNDSANANNYSPARVNGPNVYTVSSMTSSNTWSSFSNFGNPPVDYCAPGSSIYSTYKGGGYTTLSGTSMATPHVCGILLIGGITSDGNVAGDPDGNPDPIAHH